MTDRAALRAVAREGRVLEGVQRVEVAEVGGADDEAGGRGVGAHPAVQG